MHFINEMKKDISGPANVRKSGIDNVEKLLTLTLRIKTSSGRDYLLN
jgi:hypothetical protein